MKGLDSGKIYGYLIVCVPMGEIASLRSQRCLRKERSDEAISRTGSPRFSENDGGTVREIPYKP